MDAPKFEAGQPTVETVYTGHKGLLPKVAGVIAAVAALSTPTTALADEPAPTKDQTSQHGPKLQVGAGGLYKPKTGGYGLSSFLRVDDGNLSATHPYFKLSVGYNTKDFSASDIASSLKATHAAVTGQDQFYVGGTIGASFPVFPRLNVNLGAGFNMVLTESDVVLVQPADIWQEDSFVFNGIAEAGANAGIYKGCIC